MVAGLFGLSFSLAACVITEEVPYQGSTESISAQAAGAETVLIANIEEAPVATEVASNVTIPETNSTYALPRNGADTIRPYLSGEVSLPARTAGVSPSQLPADLCQNGL